METKTQKFKIGDILKRYGIIIVLILMIVFTALKSEVFLRPSNLINILRQVSINGILAVGMTMVIISGGIDLSVGATMGIAGIVLARTIHLGIVPSIICALASGVVVGLLNGTLVTKIGIPPFVATLGTNIAFRAVCVVLTGGYPLIPEASAGLKWIGAGKVSGIPVPVIICSLAFAVFIFVMNKTRFGRYIYAVGSNEESSNYSGIKVPKTRITVYAIMGFLSALAGIVLVSRLYSTGPLTGNGYETDAIAAAVIGGTSMMGGEGRLARTIIGVLILGVLSNLFNLLGVAADYQGIFEGAIIILAVGADTYSKMKKK